MNFVSDWRDWSLELFSVDWKPQLILGFLDPDLEMRNRLSIFIITGVCAGLPAFVWSVRDIIHHRKNGHRISIFIILLLFTDFLELFLSPYILIKYLLNQIPCNMDWTCWVFRILWWTIRDCGLLLNQLVALEGILSVKYTASAISSPWFIITQTHIFLCVIFCNFVTEFVHGIDLPRVALFMLILSVMSLIITCGTLCCADPHYQTSKKLDRHILVILISTLLVFYLPYVFIFFQYFQSLVFHYIFLLTSLRLISDPLLCVLVCRQNLSQKPEGLV